MQVSHFEPVCSAKMERVSNLSPVDEDQAKHLEWSQTNNKPQFSTPSSEGSLSREELFPMVKSPTCLAHCVAHSKCSVNTCWMNFKASLQVEKGAHKDWLQTAAIALCLDALPKRLRVDWAPHSQPLVHSYRGFKGSCCGVCDGTTCSWIPTQGPRDWSAGQLASNAELSFSRWFNTIKTTQRWETTLRKARRIAGIFGRVLG